MSDRKKWVHQYLAGSSLQSIAEECNVPWRIVRDEVVSKGVKIRRPGPKQVDIAHTVEWPDLYRSGLTLKKIAVRFNVSAPTVRKYLIMQGVKLRPSYHPQDDRGSWHHEAIKLRAAGWSYKAIGKRFGKASQTVFAAIQKLSA